MNFTEKKIFNKPTLCCSHPSAFAAGYGVTWWIDLPLALLKEESIERLSDATSASKAWQKKCSHGGDTMEWVSRKVLLDLQEYQWCHPAYAFQGYGGQAHHGYIHSFRSTAHPVLSSLSSTPRLPVNPLEL